MRPIVSSFVALLAVSSVQAETVWRWADPNGHVHYSNVRQIAPESATEVTTQIGHARRAVEQPADVESAAAGGIPVGIAPSEARPVGRTLRRIYDDERLRFGCYSAGVLFFGGWSHANDISPAFGCYRYLLGPEAWLNAARAELAVREAGISPRELYRMYRASQGAE